MSDQEELYIIAIVKSTLLNYFDYLNCLREIQTKIKSGEDIPNHLVKTFLSLIKIETESHYEKEHNNDVQEAVRQTLDLERFSKYRFRIKNKMPKRISEENPDPYIFKTYFHIYSFEELLHIIYHTVGKSDYKNLAKNSDLMVHSIYKIIDLYMLNIKKKPRKIFSEYGRLALAGYITQEFGVKICNGANPSNAELFQAARNAMNRIKKARYKKL